MVFLDRDGLSLTPDDETRCQSSSEERRIRGRNHSARAWSPGVDFLKKLTSQCVASVLQKHFRFPPGNHKPGNQGWSLIELVVFMDSLSIFLHKCGFFFML